MNPDPSPDPAAAPPDPAAPPRSPAERVYGVIDVLRSDRVAGWAIDRSDSAAALDIDILREGKLVRSVRGDRHRADLHKGGIGTGNYGFRADIDPPLEQGFEFTLTAVARAADGTEAGLNRVGGALATPNPLGRLMERIYDRLGRLSEAPAQPVASDADRLADAVARIEVVQARLEAALAAVEAPKRSSGDRSLGLIVAATTGVALVSLAIGTYSLFGQ